MVTELNEQQEQRVRKVEELRAAGIEPFPPRTARTHTTEAAHRRYEEIESELADAHDPEAITVAGRVISPRNMGKSIFTHIRDGSGTLQLYLRRGTVSDEEFERFRRYIDQGDFVEATGHLMRTRTGEVTLQATSFRLLTKAINPPPEKWHGLSDVETRFRQRYADLIANDDVRRVFVVRARVVSAIRRFLDERGFIEVETPILQPLYGGAAAQPFTTHYRSLDQTMYLRIADELYLKRLIVGGYDRVYEIAKDFRNEGIDARHSPEFTMLEFYIAYADYRDVMDLIEAMIPFVAREALGTTQIVYNGHDIDLAPPWRRVTLRQALIEETGIDFLEVRDRDELYRHARELGADVAPDTVWARILDELLKTFVIPRLIQPTILYDYPVQLSPLAKRSPENPEIAERFQCFIGGLENGNAFTELNDPFDQLERFLQQARDREAGDLDAMPVDEDFINALFYGMPPTGGLGLGIDRLVMLLTDRTNIREVILFPHLRTRAAF